MGTGANPNNSGQAQILHHEGTLFVINGANDVFALDVDTGAILWTYRGNPDPRAGVPMGRSSRGVTMGEGKIFVGLNDARLVALDQRTGEVVWSIEAERWQDGFSITSAPLYYDGLVITGFSGGEMASRGKVKAFSARDGKLVVDVQHRAGPRRVRARHLAAGQQRVAVRRRARVADACRRSRARARVLLDGQSRARPARRRAPRRQPVQRLDRRRRRAQGKYRWHFQQVHHDIWDYDSPNPVVLFDAP